MNKKHNPAILSSIAGSLLNASVLFPRHTIRLNTLTKNIGLPGSATQLLLLLNQEEFGVGEISEKMGIAKPNVTPLIDILEDRGMAERVRQKDDRRVVKVHLTDHGREVVSDLQTGLIQSLENDCGDLSPSELKELNNALLTLIRLMPTAK